MQDEVEDRAINLLIRTSELSLRTVMNAGRQYMAHRDRVKSRKASEKNAKKDLFKHGRQKVSELIGQGQGVENIDVAQSDLKGFEVYARKYGIDYAVRKDISEDPPKYLVFFKAKEADAMTAAFNEYAAKALKKREKKSVRQELKEAKETEASVKEAVKEKIPDIGER